MLLQQDMTILTLMTMVLYQFCSHGQIQTMSNLMQCSLRRSTTFFTTQ